MNAENFNPNNRAYHPDVRLIVVIVVLLVIGLFTHLHYLPLRAEEPRRALVALEMELSGNYIAPTINGVFYYNKPPVYNWFLVALYKLFGSYDEWVVRLPSVLSLLLTGVLHFYIFRRYVGAEVALLSALFYVTSADILFYFSLLGEIDLFYTLIVYVQIAAMLHYFLAGKYAHMFIVSGLMVAIGLLTKGLPSLLFQVFTGLALLGLERRWKLLFHWGHFVGVGIMVLVTGSYFVLYNQYNDVGLYFAKLLSESTERTMMEKGILAQVQHLFTFPFMLLKLLMPYAVLLPLLFTAPMIKAVKEKAVLRLSLMFVVVNIWVYWLSPGTKDRYLYMFLPFLFLLLAYGWVHFGRAWHKYQKLLHYLTGGFILLLAVASLASGFIPQTQMVPLVWFWALLFFGLFLTVGYLWRSAKIDNILLLALCMVLLRLEFNTTIIPIQIPDFKANAVIDDLNTILDITRRQPIYLAGNAQTLHVKTFGLGGKPLVEADLMQPPPLLFRISYYLTKATRHIVQYMPDVEKGKYYLSEQPFAEGKPYRILHRFTEPRTKVNYVLFEVE